MADGLVTFFEFKDLGFFKRNTDGQEYKEDLNLNELLSDIKSWYEDRVDISDTLMWDSDTLGYSARKRIYIKSFERNDDTGDFILVLWRAVGNGDGVFGIPANTSLNDSALYNADDSTGDVNVIWGEPVYLWLIPNKRAFATIKFAKSVSDTDALTRLLSDFVKLQSSLRERQVVEKERADGSKFLSISFLASDGSTNLWFRCSSKMFTKATEQADLSAMARDITHFVKREKVSARVGHNNSWERLFEGLPFVSATLTKETRNVEVVIEAKPTGEELRTLFETYNDHYAGGLDKWVNLGFRKEGAGKTVWLNEFVIKNFLNVPGDYDQSYYDPSTLFAALHLVRDNLIAPLSNDGTSDIRAEVA
ncbi:hypothetical protein [Paraglaciecola sp. L3A3]|uniref:hypothetical protein n=1 Tax=Paraglaciecola sp. L3A3 TaxID=2686358 RepID=UPI00131B89DD|nr:hypothetical protein [Paraglaciecola sp. L3A3]